MVTIGVDGQLAALKILQLITLFTKVIGVYQVCKGDLFLVQHDNNMKENALKKFLKLAQILSFQKLPIWPTI